MKNKWTICLTILVLMFSIAHSQNETNNWYFGEHAGVAFNSGDPIALYNGASTSWGGGTACYSDTNGLIMFYTNGESIWNSLHQVMLNGDNIGGNMQATQAAIILPLPQSNNIFYVFTVGSRNSPRGLKYTIVDMNLDGGLGVVTEKNKSVTAASDANIFLTAVRHHNDKDWWLIVRRLNNDNYASFLLTSNGLNTTPVISPTRFFSTGNLNSGQMKASPDRSLLITSFFCASPAIEYDLEMNSFNSTTGQVEPKFVFGIWGEHNKGIEYSPDSKFLYVEYFAPFSGSDTLDMAQYELNNLDSLQFFQSKVIFARFGSVNSTRGLMQLASDGKIYAMGIDNFPSSYLNVITEPWKKGSACNMQTNSIWLGGRSFEGSLPNFPQDLLYRFVWSGGLCAGVPFKFRHRFIPEPDSIHWDFGDPGSGVANTSTLHNPSHTFSAGGTYEVYTYVKYPNDRIEETSREVEVLPKPYPNLGPDTMVCANTSVTLTPGSGFAGYYWNGSIMPGNPTYLASDTGTYIVRVKNDLGCYNADTIQVMQRPAPALDETLLNIAPTTCGGSTGAITGLQIAGQPPYVYQWTATGSPISDSLDIYHLGIGLYELNVTDGFGCTNTVATYAISDAGNILIDTATATPAYCGNIDGTVSVTAVSGLGSMLQYFVKTGSDTLSQWGNGIFAGLAGGTYYVWVSDSSGCSSVYPVPLVIDALTAPVIVSATSSPETGTDADGTITVNALGAGLTYSLNGATPQNIGHFTGLSAGNYSIKVSNPAGCDTTFTVPVDHDSGIVLSAIAGSGFACLGKEAKTPLVVSNFKDVQSFETMLNYDKLFVTCIGYSNPLPQLADSLEVTVFPASGKIQTRWKGTTPLTLPDSSEMVQLVFSSQLPGNALLLWDISPAVSNFFGPGGDTLNVNYTLGTILISNPPKILPEPAQSVCEGEFLWVSATVENGTGPLSYQWQTPTGPTNQESIFKTATLADNGLYELIVTDTVQCADTSAKMVSVFPTPVSEFPIASDTLYFDERHQLVAGEPANHYLWSTGDTINQILVTAEGWYKVTITTAGGCQTTDSVLMLYAFVPLTMPNAFTPDGDGLNDVFRPVTLPEKISSFSMYIYDRWGKQVFFSNDISKGWDGTLNGNPAQIGGYVYVVKYGNPSGAVREKRGMVTVVR